MSQALISIFERASTNVWLNICREVSCSRYVSLALFVRPWGVTFPHPLCNATQMLIYRYTYLSAECIISNGDIPHIRRFCTADSFHLSPHSMPMITQPTPQTHHTPIPSNPPPPACPAVFCICAIYTLLTVFHVPIYFSMHADKQLSSFFDSDVLGEGIHLLKQWPLTF